MEDPAAKSDRFLREIADAQSPEELEQLYGKREQAAHEHRASPRRTGEPEADGERQEEEQVGRHVGAAVVAAHEAQEGRGRGETLEVPDRRQRGDEHERGAQGGERRPQRAPPPCAARGRGGNLSGGWWGGRRGQSGVWEEVRAARDVRERSHPPDPRPRPASGPWASWRPPCDSGHPRRRRRPLHYRPSPDRASPARHFHPRNGSTHGSRHERVGDYTGRSAAAARRGRAAGAPHRTHAPRYRRV